MPESLELVETTLGTYVSEAPSARFPAYTRGNAGEVWPHVAYPLSVSISRAGGHDPFAEASLATGIVDPTDLVDGPVSFGGCFHGYMYLNLSFSRMLAIRTPGVSIEEQDATFLGTEGIAPPHVTHPDDKNWRATLRAARYAWKMLTTKELPELEDDRQLALAWQRRVPDLLQAPDEEILSAMRKLIGPTMHLFANHLSVSGRAGGSMQALAGFCETRLGDRSLALTLLGGLGEVDSAAPSFALWDLGREVVASDALTAHFEAGTDGLIDRLETDPAAAPFRRHFAAFVDQFGSRGPNEWESASDTWGTNPTLALALVDRMRGAEPGQAPAVQASALAAARTQAAADARATLRWPFRRMFDTFLRAAALYSPARERSKTSVVGLIHVSRLLGRELAGRAASKVDGGTVEDMWFVLEHELDDYLADPARFADVIRDRRATRDALSLRMPPFVFEATIPDPGSWPRRDEQPTAEVATAGFTLEGLAGCPGIAEGTARVVTDPAAPGDLGPGDILIAPLTDPAWTPLFVPVEGVVVDVGGQMSHAVIVSRELGRPCVVAATGASRRIPDGARVRVDGGAGTVTVLELP